MRITANVSIGVSRGKESEEINMTSKEYKDLSVKEFTKAAEIYESDNAGVYNMCKKDYPDVLKRAISRSSGLRLRHRTDADPSASEVSRKALHGY